MRYILCIEPDDALAQQYVRALEDDFHVRVASSAQAAIQEVDQAMPDVIVLELLLGQHNGIEFIHELRSYADSLQIPIILNTYVRPDRFTSDETLLHDLGVVEYLYKPSTSLAQLKATLARTSNLKVV